MNKGDDKYRRPTYFVGLFDYFLSNQFDKAEICALGGMPEPAGFV